MILIPDISSTPGNSEETAETEEKPTEEPKVDDSPLGKLCQILMGDTTTKLHLQFLIRNNKTDLLILKHCKVGIFSGINNDFQFNRTLFGIQFATQQL